MRKIENVGWAVGNYCNANCKHCYSRGFRTGAQVLCRQDIDIILEKLHRHGVHTINFGGNEPIYTDGPDVAQSKLPYILKKAKALGFTLGITTNGTTALELYKNEEAFACVDDWDISLDSATADMHDQNRGNRFFAIAEQAIRVIKEKKKSVSIIYCLMNWNSSPLHAQCLTNLCRKYGVDLRVNTLKPVRQEHFSLLPNKAEIDTFFSAIARAFSCISCTDEVCTEGCQDPAMHKCPCGYHSLAIGSKKPDGRIPIAPCVYLQAFASGDILTQEIEEIIQDNTAFAQLQRRHETGAIQCAGCKNLEQCGGGCAAYAYLTAGDIMHADPRCGYLDDIQKAPLFHTQEAALSAKVHENYLCTYIGRLKTDA